MFVRRWKSALVALMTLCWTAAVVAEPMGGSTRLAPVIRRSSPSRRR